jgi:hypothetical protein
LSTAFDQPLPKPSPSELELLFELRNSFEQLLQTDSGDGLPSEVAWRDHMSRLRHLVLTQNAREFLRWDVVSYTMFVATAHFVRTELTFLKKRSNWKQRWKAAITESWVGHPRPYPFHPSSSGNLIHHAYHVAQFEQATGIDVAMLDFVLEFGGGYGSMCRLFHKLGFKGTYVIFDLAPFSALQTYYLKALGLPVLNAHEAANNHPGIRCVVERERLAAIVAQRQLAANTLFLATWSLSEAPVSVRDGILPLVSDFHSFLLAYQDRFGEVDNTQFFEKWKSTLSRVAWHHWQIPHLSGNSYLMGAVH